MMDFGAPETIPQVKPWLGDAERDAVAGVVAGGWLTEGPETEAFGAELNAFTGARQGVFAPNGTLALALGLMALGVGPGDEVLIPDTTFVGSATAVVMVGATPVFVDVEAKTLQLDVERAEAAITPRTRALMPVHLYGTMCDMDAVVALAERRGLLVIEDAAQAVGVFQRGRHAGTIGDVGCFSFYADKTITMGEGGYVVCRDVGVHRRLLHLRNQGRIDRGSFVHPEIGYNFRITDMQAAIGRVQLAKLGGIIDAKASHHAAYRDALAGLEEVRVLRGALGAGYVPFRCVLMAERAHDLMAHLDLRGVQARTVFAPLHAQPCFANLGGNDADFPNACHAFDHGVCLPIYPELSRSQIARVTDAVVGFYR